MESITLTEPSLKEGCVATDGYREISTSKVIRSIEAAVEIIARLLVIIATYQLFKQLGTVFFGEQYNNDMLYSIVILPTLYIFQGAHIVLAPYFVKVNICEDNIKARTGILTYRHDQLGFKTVENIELVSTLGGRVFGYTTIFLYAYGSWVRIPFVKDSQALKKEIEFNIKKAKST